MTLNQLNRNLRKKEQGLDFLIEYHRRQQINEKTRFLAAMNNRPVKPETDPSDATPRSYKRNQMSHGMEAHGLAGLRQDFSNRQNEGIGNTVKPILDESVAQVAS